MGTIFIITLVTLVLKYSAPKLNICLGGGGLSRFFFKIPNKPFTCAEFMLCNKSGVERLSTTLDEGPRHARQV